ncbi:unnamed protein product [Notodromas monacha]|uniref:Senescence domain-containing protein n=1 Tax=Notodromas monacha TaxID=399045 RepID=A0A7R9GDL5_9CRUS|nr:unnamed protein product [Notodromas monacha]CAG0917086.1 unnamed protein product [Notodromas monacha]
MKQYQCTIGRVLVMNDLPPSYEEAVAASYCELNVRLVFTVPNVTTNTVHRASSLYLYELAPGGRWFLKVEDWIWPLLPERTRFSLDMNGCLTLEVDQEGNEFPIMHGVVYGISSNYGYNLAKILQDIGISLKPGLNLPRAATSAKVDAGQVLQNTFLSGTEWVATFLMWSAFFAHSFFTRRANHLKSIMPPVEKEVHVDQRIVKGFQMFKSAGEAVTSVVGIVGEAAGGAAKCVSNSVSPYIVDGLAAVYPSGQGSSGVVQSVKAAACVACEGFEKIRFSMVNGMALVGHSARNNCASVIAHKFGDEMGIAVDEAMDAVGGAAAASYYYNMMTPRGILQLAVLGTSSSAEKPTNHEAPGSQPQNEKDEFMPSAPPVDFFDDFELLDTDVFVDEKQ